MFNDIKVASLGRVGDTVNALVVYAAKEDITSYMIGPEDFELMTHIFEVMPALVNDVLLQSIYYHTIMYNYSYFIVVERVL